MATDPDVDACPPPWRWRGRLNLDATAAAAVAAMVDVDVDGWWMVTIFVCGWMARDVRWQRYENLLDPRRYGNLLDPKDTKTFWIQDQDQAKVRKPFGSKKAREEPFDFHVSLLPAKPIGNSCANPSAV
jgi:hypothetical protein